MLSLYSGLIHSVGLIKNVTLEPKI